MKLIKVAGATSEIFQVFIQDSSSTTGAGLTGLTNGTSGLTAYYHRDTDTTATAISLASMTVGTFTSSGFKEIDATHMAGWYQFCPPNAALASGAKSCAFHLQGAANMAPLPIECQLTAVNPDSATAFITGVNSLAPPTNWNLTSIDASGRLDIIKINGTSQTARDLGASVLLSSGTGTGQLNFTSGVVQSDAAKINGVATSSVTTISANVGTTQPLNFTGTGASALVKSDMVDVAGAAVSTTSAQIGVNVVSYTSGQAPLQPTVAGRTLDVSAGGEAGVDWANIGSPTTSNGLTGTTISTSQVVASVTGAVGSVTGAVGSVTGNVGGNVTGSVGSVVGAVGSVTGNVGGNVVGSVASVAGAVGSVAGNIGGNLVGSVGSLSATAIDNVWDDPVDGSVTARQSMRLANSANGAKLSGAATTTVVIRDLADTKDRVTATVDSDGNRTAVTRDLT
jgi:hypothetical protein